MTPCRGIAPFGLQSSAPHTSGNSAGTRYARSVGTSRSSSSIPQIVSPRIS